MNISLTSAQFDLLSKLHAEVINARTEVRLASAVADQAWRSAEHFLNALALEGNAPEGFRFAGYSFSRKGEVCMLTLSEPEIPATPEAG